MCGVSVYSKLIVVSFKFKFYFDSRYNRFRIEPNITIDTYLSCINIESFILNRGLVTIWIIEACNF